MRDVTRPEESKKLKEWKNRYERAKQAYSDELSLMDVYGKLYEGDRHVNRSHNLGGGQSSKVSENVRNIVFDLIESEVDSAIPYPKVIPIHAEDTDAAKNIEAFLKYEIDFLHLKAKNDVQERTTPVQGGSFNIVEFDNTVKRHCTIGDLSVEPLHPKQVIPQEGVTEIEKMDYIFVTSSQTKEYIKRRFKKDVSHEESDIEPDNDKAKPEDIITLVSVYYRNDKGGIGLYRWVGDVEVEDLEDYEARYIKRCKKCGATVLGEECECGSKSFETVIEENETVIIPLPSGEVDVMGNPVIIQQKIELPHYKPNEFPIILRKNISRYNSFLGFSDAAAIEDQQDTIKKLGSKANEKTLMAGSVLTLPDGVNFEKNDKEFKIVRIKDPSQISMIQVVTCQADISRDLQFLETNYQWAKSALGITDAYQGKYDSSAMSGAAKQYSINQAAGRLESKRVMKNEAFAKLYELMFKYGLAYIDEPVAINMSGQDGELEFSHFDKTDYIKFDAEGKPYWNDEFLFTIDTTSTLLTNREAMWQQADQKLQSGAFGPLGDTRTMRLYWLEQERNGYPHAGEILAEVEKQLQMEKDQQAMMAQQQQMMGDMQNEVSEM